MTYPLAAAAPPQGLAPGKPRSLALTREASIDNPVIGDLDLQNGQIYWAAGRPAVWQKIQTCLSSFLGEWFLALDEGMPYLDSAVEKGVGPGTISALFRRALSRVDGVQSVDSVDTRIDRHARRAYVTWAVTLADGSTLTDTFTPFKVPA